MQYLLRNKISYLVISLCISSAALAQRDEVFRPNRDDYPSYFGYSSFYYSLGYLGALSYFSYLFHFHYLILFYFLCSDFWKIW
jgi:hypothetical protein